MTKQLIILIGLALCSCRQTSDKTQSSADNKINPDKQLKFERCDSIVTKTAKFNICVKESEFLYILTSTGDTVYRHSNIANGFELTDFNNDGYKDVLITYLTNVPNINDLLLFDEGSSSFKLVKYFDSYPAPQSLENTDVYYSYHRSGCSDENWDSDLFYIHDFTVFRLGNISGRGCPSDDEKDMIYINKALNDSDIFLKSFPITVLEKFNSDKWLFIKDYWTKNLTTFTKNKNGFVADT